MAYSAICNQLHFHFDIRNQTAQIFTVAARYDGT